MKFIKKLSFLNNYWHLFLMVILLSLSMLFKEKHFFVNSNVYYSVYIFIVILLHLIIIPLLLVNLYKKIKLVIMNKSYFSKESIMVYILIALTILSIVSVYSTKTYGRIPTLESYLSIYGHDSGDINFLHRDPRSTSFIFYNFLNKFISFNFDVIFLKFITTIYSILLIPLIFIFSNKILKNSNYSFLLSLLFILSKYVRMNFISFEAMIPAFFYLLLGLYFFKKYLDQQKKYYLFMMLLSFLLSNFYREDLFMFVLIMSLFSLVFVNIRTKNKIKIMPIISSYILLSFFLFLRMMRFIFIFSRGDSFRFGNAISSNQTFVAKLFGVLIEQSYHNFIIQKDLINLNLISFFGLIAILLFLYFGIKYLYILFSSKKQSSSIYVLYSIFIFYILYLFNQLFLSSQGLRSPLKNTFNLYLFELIICFYFILKINIPQKIILFIIFTITIFMIFTIPYYDLTLNSYYENYYNYEMESFSNLELDKNCKLLKVNIRQPKIDYYKGFQLNSIYLEKTNYNFNNDDLNHYLDGIIEDKSCYYVYEDYHILDSKHDLDGRYIVDYSIIETYFNNCSRNVIIEFKHSNKFTSPFVRFDC